MTTDPTTIAEARAQPVAPRSCNFHDDCDEADRSALNDGRAAPLHCRIEDCEDCYGN